MAAAPATKLILRTGEPDTARWSSAQIWEREVSRTQAEITVCATDWVTAIEGRAGTAKTTTVGAIKEFAAERGYLVRGFAPTTRAVKALSEAGLPARTVASLLENPIEPARKELWIIDESSLLATRQVNGLLRKARDADVDRIVFVGDQRQHHAIEAGRPIYQMQRAGMAIARLETIRRHIVAINSRRTGLRMDDGREISAAPERLRHIDHGYASTSHSSQGATVDRVIVNVDTTRSAQLVSRKQFYVSISRARHAVSIYTDDRERLRQTVSRNREKSTALAALQPKLSPGFKSVSDRILHSVNRVHGMRR
jgi:ATP-dependent exoDNAse (exonuclease V) alpha subunit